MPSTSTVSPTGNPSIDGVLAGTKWAVGSLTFSFPTDPALYGANYGAGEPLNAFQAFTAVQQAAVRSVLQNYSAVANMKFTEVTESATQSGDLRYAESNAPSTAWGYYPSPSAIGGDMWFNTSSHYYDSPVMGNYAYEIMLHETGHALGLKHPQEAMGAFATMPLDHDSVEYTVMSYRSYVGGPLSYSMTNGNYPQTLMMYDIAAVQTMYGANYTTNSGDTVYRWDPATGRESINGIAQTTPYANKIFMTLWDGGGSDTYDFSNYTTGLKVDLNPGGWTTVSAVQLAALGNGHVAAGNIANALLFQGNTASLIENAIGGSADDVISGNQADNRLTGGQGNDLLDGGSGTDIAIYTGLSMDHRWSQNADGTWLVTDTRVGGLDGSDTLKSIEKLQFGDILVSLGGTVTVPVAVNTAPIFLSAPPSATFTEWTDNSKNESSNKPHTGAGTIAYTDPNLADAHVVSFVAEGSGYLGTFALGSLNESTDSFGWLFSISDAAMGYLRSGETLTQRYDVTVDDGHGGKAMQVVTVKLVGSYDGATVAKTSKGAGQKGAGPESIVNDQAPGPQDAFSFPAVTHAHDAIAMPGILGFTDAIFGSSLHPRFVDHLPDVITPVLADIAQHGHGEDWAHIV